MTLTVRSATRRLVVLTALHWLPVGLTTPVMVLLAQSRGLSIADIGVLFGVYGVLLTVLELPTGGLADVLGRRPVLLAAAALHVASCLAFAAAGGLAGFLGAICLMGVGRALLSGPLEAWYVDAVHAVDSDADVAPGLAKQAAADGGGLAVGAVVGGALPALLGGSLAAPFLVAAALDLVYVAFLLRLMVEVRPPREGSLRAELASGARAVPATVAGAVRLSVSDGPLRRVLLLTVVGGVGLVSFELLSPVRFAELAGGAQEGAAVLGTVQAVSFGAAAGGSLLAPSLRRLLGGSTRWTCALLAVVGAGSLFGFGGTSVIPLAAGALTGYYVAHAGQWPLLAAVLHTRVTAGQRATAVSAMSLAMTLGGTLGNLVVPRLAQAAGYQTAFAAVGGLVLLSALLCLRLPSAAAVPAPSTGAPQPAFPVVPFEGGDAGGDRDSTDRGGAGGPATARAHDVHER
jgi:MFS family permease